MSLMFSGSGDDSDTISSADLPVSADRQTRFSLKLLYFFSGAALLALLLLPFCISRTWILTGAFVVLVFGLIWAYLIFSKDVSQILAICANGKISILSAIISGCISLVLFAFSAWSTVAQAYIVISGNYPIYRTLQNIASVIPFGEILNLILYNYSLVIWIGTFVLGVLSFFALYFVLRYFIAEKYLPIVRKEGAFSVCAFFISSILWVLVPLLPLYLTNLSNVTLPFILILAGVYMIGTGVVYFVTLFISKSSLASFGVCVIAWIGLSACESIVNTFFAGVFEVWVFYSLILLAVMVFGGFIITKVVNKFDLNSESVSKYVLILVVLLLVINIIPIISVSLAGESDIESHNSKSFVVDESLPHPNIYWIHAESMVDETVFEKYFGSETVGFSGILDEHGFIVNHDAYVTGPAKTISATSSLFSPSFYDTYADEYYAEDSWLVNPNHRLVTLSRDVLRNNHELILAFEAADYSTTAITFSNDYHFHSPTASADVNYLYDVCAVLNDIAVSDISPLETVFVHNLDEEFEFIAYSFYPFEKVLETLSIKNKLINSYYAGFSSDKYQFLDDSEIEVIFPDSDFSDIQSYGNLVQAFSFVLDTQESPQLVLIYPGLAHYYFDHNENGILTEYSEDLEGYYGEYIFSEKVILYLVDEILDKDPNAVIVIQGDHGLHCYVGGSNAEEKYSEGLGQDVELEEILNHVLSAVRIPEQYQTENYPEAIQNPRNIVRYLVNSYVGENYEYIPWEES